MKVKCFYLAFSAAIICNFSLAQPVIKSQKTMGGTASDYATSIVVSRDGGLICGGTSYSDISGERTQHTRGENDYWLVKLSKSGNIQFDKAIGGNAGDYLQDIEQTNDGGYILGGYSASDKSGEKSENRRGELDYWIVKLDKSGNIQWDKTIGGSRSDYLKSVRQTTDGGYILGGYSYSDISGDKTANTRGEFEESDYWLVKLNKFGQIEWDKTIGGDKADFAYAIDATTDGGSIVGGYSQSDISGEKTGANRGVVDYWVVKLDNSGNIQWDKTIGGDKYDYISSLQQTRDGGYILGGSSESGVSGEKTDASRGYFDYWIVKLNSAGDIQWNKAIGGSGVDGFMSLQQTMDDGYILGGVSYSNISGEKSEYNRGEGDYWIVKLNRFGQYEWDKTIGGHDYDELWEVTETQRNVYVIAGASSSPVSEDKTEASRGEYDYWIVGVQYSKPESISITSALNKNAVFQKNNKDFVVYPNPAADMLHVQLNYKTSVVLCDEVGHVLLTKIINGNGTIDITGFKQGLYYLKNNAKGEVKKIVVMK